MSFQMLSIAEKVLLSRVRYFSSFVKNNAGNMCDDLRCFIHFSVFPLRFGMPTSGDVILYLTLFPRVPSYLSYPWLFSFAPFRDIFRVKILGLIVMYSKVYNGYKCFPPKNIHERFLICGGWEGLFQANISNFYGSRLSQTPEK